MKRTFATLALVLSGIGLAGCVAGLIAIWVMRPAVLRSSAEYLDAADGGLKLVEEKTTRAGELVKQIQAVVDPVAGKILELADRTDRSPGEEKELQRVEKDLAERLRQVDAIAETAETAIAFLTKTSKLAAALPLPVSRITAAASPGEDSQVSSDTLSRLATKLKDLRAGLALLRENKQVQKQIAADVVRIARDVDRDLKTVDSGLERAHDKAVEWQTEVTELRTAIPAWTNAAAVVGSLILAWMGLGQFVLLRRTWVWMRPDRPASPA